MTRSTVYLPSRVPFSRTAVPCCSTCPCIPCSVVTDRAATATPRFVTYVNQIPQPKFVGFSLKKPTRGTKTAHQTSAPRKMRGADRERQSRSGVSGPGRQSAGGGERFVLELLSADAGLGHQPALHVREDRDPVPELGDGGGALIQGGGARLGREVHL